MVAVLFTDLVGSTDLMTRVGQAAFDDVERAGALLAQALAGARELGLGGVERQAVALLTDLDRPA